MASTLKIRIDFMPFLRGLRHASAGTFRRARRQTPDFITATSALHAGCGRWRIICGCL
jgi:hypothetical protein